MYEGIYLVFIRSLCIFVDILTVCYTFILFNIKYEYNITSNTILFFWIQRHLGVHSFVKDSDIFFIQCIGYNRSFDRLYRLLGKQTLDNMYDKHCL